MDEPVVTDEAVAREAKPITKPTRRTFFFLFTGLFILAAVLALITLGALVRPGGPGTAEPGQQQTGPVTDPGR